MSKLLFAALILMSAASAEANICGTDYQTFNPTTSGLDFVTVQSSETLKPCIINMGLFANYAANSLSYSRTVSAGQSGHPQRDRILGMDLNAGMGLTDRWDFGVNIPFVLSQEVKDDANVSTLSKTGATEIKANTKYRLTGNENGGTAAIVSINKNLIQDNPFTGKDPGLTWNFEVAADTTVAKNWAAGVNFGYRKRNPGEQIANVPYVPMGDQWIYSVAGSYLVASLDTKFIAEIYGSRAAERSNPDIDRPLNTLEGLLGVKHDYSQNIALHLGATHRLDQALGGAEWRVYAGLNWVIGPVCGDKKVVEVVSSKELGEPELDYEIYKLDVELLFATDSDQIKLENFDGLDEVLKPVFEKEFKALLIDGHTDSVGPDLYNLNLSRRRAESIRKLLIERYKLDPKKLEASGKGKLEPIADNGNYQGRRKNRRVELKVWRKPPLKNQK